jgi:hypothetical protein
MNSLERRYESSFKPVLGDVDGNLHFPERSMNRLIQTEPATFYNFAVLGFLY